MSLSILLPSAARPMLRRLVDSVVGQLDPGDELLIDCGPGGCWGYPARQRLTQRATCEHLLWNDDDDVYTPEALSFVRAGVAEQPEAVHIFRMVAYWGTTIWTEPKLVEGNVGAQMLCIPIDVAQQCTWGTRYQADFDFAAEAASHVPVCWHPEVIVKCRP